jgi:hypothetical protein
MNRDDDYTRSALLDLVAAVDYLSRHHRYGLTIFEAIDEAVRDSIDALMGAEATLARATSHHAHHERDPLRATLLRLFEVRPQAGAIDGERSDVVITAAIASWVRSMADQYNESHHFPHPAPTHGWPSPLYT